MKFYDDLADYYHLIYPDWDASIERQGDVLANLIRSEWSGAASIADVACGIGTQSLGLAARGFSVEASDLSPRAVERASREAAARDFAIHARVDDMRELRTHSSSDVVIACDNAVPHLLSDDEILSAFRQFHRVARRGCIISVRDYASLPRAGRPVFPFGVQQIDRDLVTMTQVWDFHGDIYDLNFYFVFDDGSRVDTRVFRAKYYAVTIDKLIALMQRAGFKNVRRLDDLFFQPLILGSA